ncbi:alpha-(1,3)-fucosyltransferase 10 [Vanessa cardui]|uniref:alpha-(1,3)-fucosyltransferase 10 n=1 Tax=Vanessa cardui TaxID=171605 RepID=UPI001F13EAEA|nr:alpha-(1,3)-fucosyltransferase 10 [Vanessa cardui]XP_046959314.1 alpha-(1,3)-fucosyltransferase 10 [Vanessa cardui]XP_046959315.1 alpha-(1,3)-fucosyltransferase 10 [Vanessa cardui]XP_046959316.1 alpha-(1,3)-fucosyltransferase 10 [Vanessa cardui]XP_046959318.1 alpha-(1,3)-fucosyltransferase 10 [Vanessa cardui]XP_046959319.1 alpha-(1,3)-fucosyltransferase 10 [Vanessa cardui]
MCRVFKIWKKIYRRIFKVTLNEVAWIGAISLTILLIWTWINGETKVHKHGDYPVIMWWTSGFPGTSETIHCPNNIKCDFINDKNYNKIFNVDAYLFYASNIKFDDLPLPRNPNDILWGLYHEESPRNVEELLHEKILSLFNYSATFSRYSDIPFPLQYLESLEDITSTKYFKPTRVKTNLLNELSPILYLQSDCETATERDIYVKELIKFIDIDSYGACLNNKEMPTKFQEDYLNNLNDDDFLNYISRYKFVLAIENGVCDDYVTEKFWRAIKIGTVPIYFGSPTIKDWLPNNKSAILLEDFPTPKIMSEHLKKLLNNDNLYDEYLTHKTKEEITNKKLIDEFITRQYQRDTLEVASKFECFICEKLHEKKVGIQVKRVVSKRHYDCPKPISALTLQVNPSNDWVYTWETAKKRADDIYQRVINFK